VCNGCVTDWLPNILLTRKEGSQRVQLSHDAPAGPLVDGGVVVGRPQKHLWSAVPAMREDSRGEEEGGREREGGRAVGM
jgi:hypothetical protein